MRRTVPRKKGEDRATLNLLVPLSLDTKLREYADNTGDTLTAIVTRGIEKVVSGEKDAPSPAKKSGVAFPLNELDQKVLAQLAEDTLKLDDPNLFARLVIRKALDLGPEVMREFLLGQVKREVQAKMEEENAARAEQETSARQKTETTKRAKKAA